MHRLPRCTPAAFRAQVILSHTPFQALATPGAYQARPVLAVGRGQVRRGLLLSLACHAPAHLA